MCTPLKDVDIYTIFHEDPIRYVEIYVDEFVRCIALALNEDRTMLSIDRYPMVPQRDLVLDNARSIGIDKDGVTLVEIRESIESLPNELKRMRTYIEDVRTLYLCLGKERTVCTPINTKLLLRLALDKVLETVCKEDILEISYRAP